MVWMGPREMAEGAKYPMGNLTKNCDRPINSLDVYLFEPNRG